MRYEQKGFTLPELAVVMGILSLVIGGLIQQYTASVTAARDHGIRLEAHVHAQALLQTLAGEVRILGNGVPFDQNDFQIGEIGLTDPSITNPIDVGTSTATRFAFRLNETGEVAVLTADFDPALGATITLHDTGEIAEGDPVYISNATMSEDDGFYAIVDSVDSSANQIDVINMDYSAGADFETGSTLEVVPIVTYESAADGTVTRDSGFGPVVMANRATMAVQYLDFNANPLTLPLTEAMLVNQLRSVEITVSATSAKNLKETNTPYQAVATQRVGLRNLKFMF